MKSLTDKIRDLYFKPKAYTYIFLATILMVSIFYGYPKIISLAPQSLHAWRQCDCLSITMNYYQDNLPFLNPAVHCQESDNGTSGHTISEFPIIYYTVAQIWKITGQKEWIFRLLVLLLVFTGLFFLFKMTEDILKDSFLGIIVVLILFSSPMFVYYSNNFIANTPAMGISLVALWFFYRFYKSGKTIHLIMMAILYLLSGLLKITSSLTFVVVLFIYFSELIGLIHYKPGKEKIFNKPLLQAVPLLMVLAGLTMWYWFASHYNQSHGAGYFLIGILPIWKANQHQIHTIITLVHDFWYKQYHMPFTLFISGIILLTVAVFNRKIPRLFVTFTLLLFVGMSMYLVLFFKVLSHHDYYLINLLIGVVFIFISGFLLLKQSLPKIYYAPVFRIILIIFVLANISYAGKNIRMRYNGWPNTDYKKYYEALDEIPPYLRSIGIHRDDKVISLPDPSWNVSLYLMDQKGWTAIGGKGKGKDRIEYFKSKGAKYLIIFDPKVYQDEYISDYIQHKVGKYKNVDIYSLTE